MSAVYFAKVGDYVKIGFASNPTHRVKSILKGGVKLPDDLDVTLPVELVLVIPFCRMRDEANLHLLFGNHWSGVGEWFRWSPAFRYQMETMQFVTHAVRLKHLRAARRAAGLVGAGVKEAHFGKTTVERLSDHTEQVAS